MSKQSQENYYKELLNMWIELNLPLIDLRPHTEFMKIHLLDTGNIPVDQLNDRAHMLPPKKSELCILGTEEEIAKGREYFLKHGYLVTLVLKDSAHLWAAAKEHQLAVENSSISKMFWKPSPCLEKVIEIIETMRYEMGLLRQGLAIDLACGSGRDLVFLALRGWTAVGFDYLESARKRALELANQCGTSIEIHCIDIERCYNEILTR